METTTKGKSGRLVLGRTKGESITFQTSDEEISIELLKTWGDFFRVAIQAPREVQILRSEVPDNNL